MATAAKSRKRSLNQRVASYPGADPEWTEGGRSLQARSDHAVLEAKVQAELAGFARRGGERAFSIGEERQPDADTCELVDLRVRPRPFFFEMELFETPLSRQ